MRNDRSQAGATERIRGRIEVALVAILLLGALLIRAYHFGLIPVGVHQDEAMAAVEALALSNHGTDRFGMRYPVHFTAWVYGQMSAFLSYLMVPFIKLFGFSVISIRLPMLLLSCIGLGFLYVFARKLDGTRLGLIALLLGIICPWHYLQSRWSLDCNAFPHMFLMGACLLLFSLGKKWLLYLAMVFFGLCSYCYAIANYSVPLFLAVSAVILFRLHFVKIREIVLAMVVYVTVALPEFLTMLINMMGWDSIETPWFTIPYFPESERSADILFLNFSFEQLWKNVKTLVATVFWKGDPTSANNMVEFGPLYYFTVIFFVIGLAVLFRKLKKTQCREEKACYGVLLAWLGMSIWVGVVTKEVYVHRINIIFYPILLIAALGILKCIQKRRLLALPIGGLYLVSALLFAYSYYRVWVDRSRDFYFETFVNGLYYADELECDYYCISPDPQGSGKEQISEILTMFCHEIDALYYQGVTNVQDGRERLPYPERYCYELVDQELVDAHEAAGKSVVYLVAADRLEYFSREKYDFASFYDVYYVVSKKVESN